jgi:hypothetical protein
MKKIRGWDHRHTQGLEMPLEFLEDEGRNIHALALKWVYTI